MYSAYGTEYGNKVETNDDAPAVDGESGDVRVDDAVESAMAQLRPAKSGDSKRSKVRAESPPKKSEAEAKIEASFKRRTKAAEADDEIEALESDAARRKREREERRKKMEEEAEAEEAAKAKRR